MGVKVTKVPPAEPTHPNQNKFTLTISTDADSGRLFSKFEKEEGYCNENRTLKPSGEICVMLAVWMSGLELAM